MKYNNFIVIVVQKSVYIIFYIVISEQILVISEIQFFYCNTTLPSNYVLWVSQEMEIGKDFGSINSNNTCDKL